MFRVLIKRFVLRNAMVSEFFHGSKLWNRQVGKGLLGGGAFDVLVVEQFHDLV